MKKGKLTNILKYGTLSLILITMVFSFLFSSLNVSATSKIADNTTVLKFGESLGDNYSTEYAGRIWSDKSVYTNDVSLDGSTYTVKNENEFLNVFSTLATSESISGEKVSPLDVVFIIDISGSMSNADSAMDNGNSRIYNTVVAVNDAIDKLMELNQYTRVGVVAFSSTSQVLLPLDRYTKTKSNGNDVDYFTLSRNTANKNNATLYTKAVPSSGSTINKSTSVSGGTNIQLGYYEGMNILASLSNTDRQDDKDIYANIDGIQVKRTPSVIILSDGAPTYSSDTSNWWQPGNNNNNGPGSSSYYGNGFKALITAAYMKAKIDRTYGLVGSSNATSLYSVGMGISELVNYEQSGFNQKYTGEQDLAYVTLNPKGNWYVENGETDNVMSESIYNAWQTYITNDGKPTIQTDSRETFEVKHPSSNDIDEDQNALKNLVDIYYDADNANAVTNVFQQIVSNITIATPQVPTEVKGNDPFASGFITYTDPIGEYMEVKSIDGIIFHDQEFKKDKDGTTVNITEKESVTTYVFENANKPVKTFVHGEQNINLIKIQVTKDANNNETLKIEIPAALIPLRINSVKLGANENVVSHTHNGALPLHIIYTVGIRDGIITNNGLVDSTEVSEEYIQNHSNADGTVNFYSNLFTNNKVNGESVGNATVEFEPSHSNPFYYIQKNIPIYSDANCTRKVTSITSIKADQKYYYKEHYYHGDRSVYLVVERTGEQLLGNNLVIIDGVVNRAVGSPRPQRILEFAGAKETNITSTASKFYYPTFEYAGNNTDPFAGKYKVYLGNNGVLKVNATGVLEINKTVTAGEGLIAPDQSFTFRINFNGNETLAGTYPAIHKNAQGEELHESQIADGSTITLKADETVTILNLPHDATYEVTEISTTPGFELKTDKTVNGTIQAGSISNANFINHYSVKSVITEGFKVVKNFTGRDWLQNDSFTFILESENLDTPMPQGSVVEENNHMHATVTSTQSQQEVQFGEITYTKPGTYNYILTEQQPANLIPGVSYSGAMYKIMVVVEDTGNGTLTKTVTMTQTAADDGKDLNVVITDQKAVFTNKFDAEEVNWIPVGFKKYIDNSDAKPLQDNFLFKIEAITPNAPLPSTNGRNDVVPNSSVEVVYEAITFTKEHAGSSLETAKEYKYSFTEVIPEENQMNGMNYDTHAYEVSVKVYLDGENIVVVPTYPSGKNHVEFTNIYTPKPTFIQLGGNKVVEGREWLENETFTFNLTATNDAARALTFDNEAKATVTNKTFLFDKVEITKPGTYTFEMTETKGQAGGMTYDEKVVKVEVKVEDVNGELTKTIKYDNVETLPTFTNTYTSIFTGTPISVEGEKHLTGKPLEEGEFFYVVEPIEDAPLIKKDVLVTNNKDEDSDGIASINILENITFTKAGIFQYKVYERIPENPVTGMKYDSNYFMITVQVDDNFDGTLTARTPVITKHTANDSEIVDKIQFINEYKPTPIQIKVPTLTKILRGFRNEALKADEFSFNLSLTEATLLDGTAITNLNDYVVLPSTTTVKNDANGKITFDEITFKQAGYYTIKISEVIPEGATANADGTYTLGSITYTNQSMIAKIQVVDDYFGKLSTAVVERIGGGEFINHYATSANLDVIVSKLFTGRTNNVWEKDDAFTFELLVADDVTKQAITDGYVVLPETTQITIDSNDADHKALLGNIQFTKPGTYKFIVREVPGTIAGVNYDGNAKEIEVVVTDLNNGTMSITGSTVTETNNQYTSNVSFTNTYDPASTLLSGHHNLHVNKVFTGRDWLDTDQFTFELKYIEAESSNINYNALKENESAVVLANPIEGNPNAELLTVNKNNKDVAHFGGITFNTTGRFVFTITEQPSNLMGVTDDANKTRKIFVDVTTEEGKLVATVNEQLSNSLTFTNTYTAKNTTLMIPVEKVFEGRTWTDDYEFTFNIVPRTKETLDEIGKSITLPNNSITIKHSDITNGKHVKAFDAITFAKPGRYVFTVTEATGEDEQITYDEREYVVNVLVEDNNQGQLVATYNYEGQNLIFKNTYTPEAIEVPIAATKKLTGRNLKDNEFIFSIYSVGNAPLPEYQTPSNKGNNVDFGKAIYTQEGTYEYVISEVKGTLGGITYDTKLVNVKVQITYNENTGTFSSNVLYNNTTNLPEFVNFYETIESDPIRLTLNKVVTPTEGNMFIFGEDDFRFEIKQTGEKTLNEYPTTVSTNHHGIATIFDDVVFDEAGTYTFEVKEVNTNKLGVRYDTSVYTVQVEVTDNLYGKLETSVSMKKGETVVNAITFNNGYDPEDETVILKGEKVLEGKPLNADEFTFTLEASEQTPNAPLPENNGTITVTNDKDGKFEFGTITYDKPGVYVYEIKELAGTNPGITYDTNVAIATVTVKDIHGELTATVVYENKTAATDKAEFINKYTATFDEETAVSLSGNKTLTGQTLENDEFTFSVQMIAPTDGEIETVKNAADGTITFLDEETYSTAGTYVYEIKEVVDEPITGMTYDKTVYTVTVEVSDNYNGTLSASEPVITVNDEEVEGIHFKNIYVPTPNKVELPLLKKVIAGHRHDPLAENEFTFLLDVVTATPQDGIKLPTEKTVGNKANGDIVFEKITFTKAGTYTLKVSEVIPETPAQGMTYETEKFEITYVVTDDSKGNLTVSVENTNGENEFRNEYNSQGTLALEVEKVLQGREWFTTDEFTFELLIVDDATLAAQEAGHIVLPEDLTVEVNKNAKEATFDNIVINKEGTYEVVVREVTTNKIPGVHYDSLGRHVVITATDNSNGEMNVTYTVKDNQTLTFTNIYDTDSTELNGHDHLRVTKNLTGRPQDEWLETDEFVFTLAGKDEATVDAIKKGDVVLGPNHPESTTLVVTHLNKAAAHFENITFKEAGTYYFTVTEETTNIPGVVNDPNPTREICVVVTDTGQGTLVARRNDNETLEFNNTYSTKPETFDGSTHLEVTKVLEGRNWFDTDTFTFALTAENHAAIEAIQNENIILPDDITIDMKKGDDGRKAFGDITFKAPGEYQFAITEMSGNIRGMSYDAHRTIVTIVVKDDNNGNLEIDDPTYDGSMTFTNIYTPNAISATFNGNKVLNGRTLKANEFEFVISAINNAPLPETTTVKNDKDGNISFGSITYEKPGEYEYEIKEVKGTLAGIKYDSETVHVTVTITNNKETGMLEKQVTYSKPDGNGFTFTNNYSSHVTDPVVFSAKKEVLPSIGNTYTMEEGTFKFQLTPAESNPESDSIKETIEVTNNADGTVNFITERYNAVGTYVYTVREINNGLLGFTYDSKEYTITVVVSDDTSIAKLQTEVTITLDGEEVDAITFTNEYEPNPGSIALKGIKFLDGKDLQDKEFTFTLSVSEQTPNAPLPETVTVKNDSEGKFEFGSIEYKQPGVYVYEIKEQPGTNEGIEYDTNTVLATVTIKDVNGQLTPTVSYENKSTTKDKAEFFNNYSSTFKGEPIKIEGIKTLNGQTLENDEFTFSVQMIAPTVGEIDTVKNAADGTITFLDEVTYSTAGTYVYEIKEVVDEAITGMTYDGKTYKVSVVVSDDNNGTLSASEPTIEVSEDDGSTYNDVDEITFTNTYVPTPKSVKLPVFTKVIDGYRHNPLAENEFSFELELVEVMVDEKEISKDQFDNYVELPDETTVKNELDGTITFKEIKFHKAGIYRFAVSEVLPEVEENGMTYDEHTYEITYEVTDDSKGNLTATVTNTKGNQTFTNEYESQGSLQLKVNKVFTGRDNDIWLDSDKFSFELLIVDDATLAAQEAGHIVLPEDLTVEINKNAKEATFDNIVINKEGTYEVVVREVTTNKIPGVHYDSHGRHVEITTTDNSNGEMNVTYTVKDNLTLTFTNIYDTDSTELNGHDHLRVTKNLTGRPENKWLETDKFVFTLAGKDEATVDAINKGDVVLESTRLEVTHLNKAAAHFGNITFKEAGTYYFTVTEETTSIPGVVNDPNPTREICVVVTDTGQGTLVARRNDNENLYFNNTYKADEIELIGETHLKVTKELAGRNWFDTDTFTFTLKAANQVTKDAVAANNIILPETEIIMRKGDNGSKAFGNIKFKTPGEYQFAITETKENIKGMTYDEHEVLVDVIVADNDEGQLIVASPSYAGSMTFKNTYTPDEIFIPFQGNKVLNGRTLKANEFEFEITAINNAPLPAVTTTANDAEGHIVFAPINFDSEGVYEYEIKEVNGTLAGIKYDSETVHVTVTITNNQDTGELEETVVYNKPDGKGFTFTNHYYSENTDEIEFFANKVVTPTNGNSYTLEEGTFKFQLTPAETNPASDPIKETLEVTNNAEGEVDFRTVKYSEEGTYVYTIREVENFLPGITYDDSVYTITVVVTDNTNIAKLQKEVTITKDGKEVNTIAFYNTYNPSQTSATIDGHKTLIGGHKELEENEFTFTLQAITENAPLPESSTTTNDATGNFKFGSIVFIQEGVYTYQVKEVNDGKTGVTYDNNVYTVTVTVTNDQANGGLVATVSGLENVQFVNKYVPNSVTVTEIEGFKQLDGRELNENEFTFELIDVDANVIETTNNADGIFKFDAITFDKAGTYNYTIVEKDSAIGGITFDETRYQVVIDVVDNKGNLEATVSYYKDNQKVDEVVFNNTYTASSTEITISAIKELVGRVLEENEFTFNLYEANEFYETSNLINSAKNNAEGIVTFEKVTFDSKGTYYFVVNEKQESMDRVTFDTTNYGYEVIVKDDLNGHLVVDKVTVTNLRTQELASAIFKNVFTPRPQDIAVQIKVQKTVTNTGNIIVGPKDFEFVVEDLETGKKQTMKTDENGIALFTLGFSEEDINKTFNYKVSETQGTLNDMVYDDTAYHVQVEIKLNENNELVAVVSKNGKIVGTQVITDFVNVNNANNDPILTIHKTQATTGMKPTVDMLTVEKQDKVTYFLTVKNTGKGEANNVVITDVLPKGLTYVENSASNAGVFADGILTWNIDTLAPGKEVTVSFEARVNEEDIKVKNLANVTADNHDNTTSNQVEITVVPEAETPDTSDNTHVYNYMMMMFFASAIIVVLKMKEALEG